MNYTQERTLKGKTTGSVEAAEAASEREVELERPLDKLMDRLELVTWGM